MGLAVNALLTPDVSAMETSKIEDVQAESLQLALVK